MENRKNNPSFAEVLERTQRAPKCKQCDFWRKLFQEVGGYCNKRGLRVHEYSVACEEFFLQQKVSDGN